MHVSVAFRHMDPSNAIERYAADKLEHVVGKYITGEDIDSRIVFSVEKFRHIANFTLNINGLTVKSVEKTNNMYSSVDIALDKLERQLRRFKDKIRSHKPSHRKRAFTMEVVAMPSLEEAYEELEPEFAEPEEEPTPEEEPVQVLKRETYTAPFMSTQDAIMQLELRGGQFFVFTSEATERIGIVYRLEDGKFGVIDAEPESV